MSKRIYGKTCRSWRAIYQDRLCRENGKEKQRQRLTDIYKKIPVCLVMVVIMGLAGCTQIGSETESGRQEIDFTVVEQREIPEKLLEVIEKNKEDEIRLSYTEGENLYLVRGYGQQKTGGYSIAVVECTEDESTIWFDTRLLGPESQEKLAADPSYPYLVVRMELREKEIMIE